MAIRNPIVNLLDFGIDCLNLYPPKYATGTTTMIADIGNK